MIHLSQRTADAIKRRNHMVADAPEYGGEHALVRITRALRGQGDPEMLETTRRFIDSGRISMDNVTQALLRHLGIAPAIAAMVNNLFGQAEIGDDEGPLARLSDVDGTSWVLASAMAGNRVRWLQFPAALEMPPLPETISISLDRYTGKPLQTMLSHPALDTMNLEIGKITVENNRVRVCLRGVVKMAPGLMPDPSGADGAVTA